MIKLNHKDFDRPTTHADVFGFFLKNLETRAHYTVSKLPDKPGITQGIVYERSIKKRGDGAFYYAGHYSFDKPGWGRVEHNWDIRSGEIKVDNWQIRMPHDRHRLQIEQIIRYPDAMEVSFTQRFSDITSIRVVYDRVGVISAGAFNCGIWATTFKDQPVYNVRGRLMVSGHEAITKWDPRNFRVRVTSEWNIEREILEYVNKGIEIGLTPINGHLEWV